MTTDEQWVEREVKKFYELENINDDIHFARKYLRYAKKECPEEVKEWEEKLFELLIKQNQCKKSNPCPLIIKQLKGTP